MIKNSVWTDLNKTASQINAQIACKTERYVHNYLDCQDFQHNILTVSTNSKHFFKMRNAVGLADIVTSQVHFVDIIWTLEYLAIC